MLDLTYRRIQRNASHISFPKKHIISTGGGKEGTSTCLMQRKKEMAEWECSKEKGNVM